MSDEVTLEMSIPLDSDGFLRRECPTCEREFKWLPTSEEEVDPQPVADGGYFCPYCGIQAPSGTWLTQAQVELAQNIVETEIVAPMIEKFGNDTRRNFQDSGGMVSANIEYQKSEEPGRLTESDDMKRVDFTCHPSEPVKILDDWRKVVHCLICGNAN